MSDPVTSGKLETLRVNGMTAGAYILSGCLLASFTHFHGHAFPVFLPLGIALACVLLYGPRILPGVFLGAVGLTLTFWLVLHPHPKSDLSLLALMGVATLVGVGATLQTWTGGYILRRWLGNRDPFARVPDLIVFVLVAGLLNSLIHTNFTVTALMGADLLSWDQYGRAWLTGWLGDSLGVLLIVPIVTAFRHSRLRPLSLHKKLEALVLAGLLYLGAKAIFYTPIDYQEYPLILLSFPFLVWTAFRFRQVGGVVVMLGISLLAIWGSGQTEHQFEIDHDKSVLLLQLYLFGLMMTTFLLHTLLNQSDQATRQAVRFGAILEKSYNEIYLVDARTFRFVYVNEGARHNLGYSLKELQQYTPLDIAPEFNEERLEELFSALKNGTEPRPVLETLHKRKNGSTYPAEVRLQIARLEEEEWIVGVAMDISEKRQIQREILAAREKAEQANRAKSIFLSSMSHEIRTPMNAILGYSQILNQDPNLKDDQRRKLGGIQKAGYHLLSLINDVLDFSKIEAGKLKLNPQDFNLVALVNELCDIFRVRCEEKKLSFELHQNLGNKNHWVHGDQGKLRQVLINLLDNALKFTDQGRVVFSVSGKPNNLYWFEIHDTGIGIPEEKQKTVFNYYEQDWVGMERGGTGLGLTISQKLAKMMKGELRVSSEPGTGSRFSFSIPLLPVNTKETPLGQDFTKVTRLSPEYEVRALVVDDNEANVDVLYEILSDVGVEVRRAYSGKEGIEIAGAWKPDIVFMDYKMPQLNGLEAAKAIQHEDNAVRIVIVTASNYRHERDRFLNEGIDGFVGKPFLRDELLKTVQEVLHVEFQFSTDEASENIVKPNLIPGETNFSEMKVPDFLLLNLKKMAKLGMIAEMEKQLPEIEKIEPQGPQLASHLKILAEKFDKEGILKLLDTVGHD
ncbi:MASE1 domain-containing protein [Nitrospina watsonii]|uniref:histidine kinase n=1 Tax=Nitrospina watsonii TaxID=1323948 RepID=A0ABN8VUY0_9BACT|nr:MASE1 domain-containing protein [Nitrospina watsonii]CAI2717610.1 Putative Histidine kinase [Nitrospina watsonii]